MSHRLIAAVLVIGLSGRAIALLQTGDLELHIADEQQYTALAESLMAGRGFAWTTGEPTSLRPPMYPAFLAGVWSLAGDRNLQAVRAIQIVVALATALLTFELGRRVFDRRTGCIAASLVWLYPPLAYLNFTILTETLFTFLLAAFVLLAVMLVQQQRAGIAIACGLALGAGALTRSVLWPVPILLCPLLLVILEGPLRRRAALTALLVAGYAVVVVPWAVRNTRLQGVFTVVDTIGGMNLRMGNYEHTPEDRMWDAVSVSGEKNWVYALTQQPEDPELPADRFTEGHKEKWAQRMALAYMRAHPWTTLRRAAIKFTDLWGLERSFLAAVQQRVYVVPGWIGAVIGGVMVLSSAALILGAAAGVWLARPEWRVHVVLLVPIALVTAVHTIVFGHSRYHLPLVPIMSLYAVRLFATGTPRTWWRSRPAVYGAAAVCLVILAGWLRQIFVVDFERVKGFFG